MKLIILCFSDHSIPFQQAHHLVNPWDDREKVQISRDGQVRLHPDYSMS